MKSLSATCMHIVGACLIVVTLCGCTQTKESSPQPQPPQSRATTFTVRNARDTCLLAAALAGSRKALIRQLATPERIGTNNVGGLARALMARFQGQVSGEDTDALRRGCVQGLKTAGNFGDVVPLSDPRVLAAMRRGCTELGSYGPEFQSRALGVRPTPEALARAFITKLDKRPSRKAARVLSDACTEGLERGIAEYEASHP